MMSEQPHISIKAWLQTLGMEEYFILFRRYNGVEDILHLKDADLKMMGLQNPVHISCLSTSLVMLKDKLEKKYGPMTSTRRPNVNIPHDFVRSKSISPTSPISPGSKPGFQLENHPWYHGIVPRSVAEDLTEVDGDFLVRDSTSSQGAYVLSCQWNGDCLHFVINKQVTARGLHSSRVRFHFESESFDTVPGLINYYVTSKKAITELSRAVISRPIPRTKSVDYYEIKNPAIQNILRQQNPVYSFQNIKGNQRKMSDQTGTTPILPGHESLRRLSQPQVEQHINTEQHLGSLPTMTSPTSNCKVEVDGKQKYRCGSDPNLSALTDYATIPEFPSFNNSHGSDSDLTKPPPPKPLRIPSIKVVVGYGANKTQKPIVQIRNHNLYEEDGRDYSDLNNVLATPTIMKEGKDRFVYSEGERPHTSPLHRSIDLRGSNSTGSQLSNTYSDKSLQRACNIYAEPETNPGSSLRLSCFISDVLPTENKPLDSAGLSHLKTALLNHSPKVIAEHFTKYDVELLKVCNDDDLGLGITSGLELITLPQGKQLRLDILERCNCLALVVMVSVLTCNTPAERVELLHQWIQIAVEMKASTGNYLSMSAILDGLQHIQISRLSTTWQLLKVVHNNSAFMLEAKLSPICRSMNQGCWSLPLENVSIPHVRPLVELLERDPTDVTSLRPWEQVDRNSGIDIILAHLDTARIISEQGRLYKVKSEIVLSKLVSLPDLTEVVSCEFHMRLLFGSRDLYAVSADRLEKFERVLAVLSDRLEPRL